MTPSEDALAHVLLGRIVVERAGGVSVESASVDVLVTGYDETPDLTTNARTAADGRFVAVYTYENVGPAEQAHQPVPRSVCG